MPRVKYRYQGKTYSANILDDSLSPDEMRAKIRDKIGISEEPEEGPGILPSIIPMLKGAVADTASGLVTAAEYAPALMSGGVGPLMKYIGGKISPTLKESQERQDAMTASVREAIDKYSQEQTAKAPGIDRPLIGKLPRASSEGILPGVWDAIASTAEGLTTPKSLATLGAFAGAGKIPQIAKAVHPLAMAAFGPHMAGGVAEGGKQLVEGMRTQDPTKVGRGGTEALINTLFLGGLAGAPKLLEKIPPRPTKKGGLKRQIEPTFEEGKPPPDFKHETVPPVSAESVGQYIAGMKDSPIFKNPKIAKVFTESLENYQKSVTWGKGKDLSLTTDTPHAINLREKAWHAIKPYQKAYKDVMNRVENLTEAEANALRGELHNMYARELKAVGGDIKPEKGHLIETKDYKDLDKNANEVLKGTDIDTTAILELTDALYKTSWAEAHYHKQMGTDKIAKVMRKSEAVKGKKGVTPEQMTQYMEYIDSDGPMGKPFFNPKGHIKKGWLRDPETGAKLKEVIIQDIPEFSKTGLKVPEGALLDSLFQLRRGYNDTFMSMVDQRYSYMPMDQRYKQHYLNRYVMDSPLVQTREMTPINPGDVYNPATLKHKMGGKYVKNRDIFDLTNKYVGQAAKTVTPEYAKAMLGMERMNMELEFSGFGKEAKALRKHLEKQTGFVPESGRTRPTNEVVMKLMKGNAKNFERFLVEQGVKPSVGSKILREVYNQMYKSWIGLNVRNMVAQYAQFVLSGGPELGTKRVLKRQFTKRTLKDMKELDLVRERLREHQYNPFEAKEQFTSKGMPSKWSPVSRALGLAGEPGIWLQGKIDMLTREQAYLTAREFFLENREQALKTMTEVEKLKVNKALQKGNEVAAREYGVLKSQTILNRFSQFNKAWTFKEGYGQLIPFTNFTRGELAKTVENIKNAKNPAHRQELIKRIALPMTFATLYSIATLDPEDLVNNIYYFTPVTGAARLITGGALPSLANIEDQAYKGPKAALKAGASGLATPNLLINKLPKMFQ